MAKLREKVSWLAKSNQIDRLSQDVFLLGKKLESNHLLLGRMFANKIRESDYPSNLQEAEFKIFSQWGDDGIIQCLVNHLEIPVKTFVEFGVENYTEANTRFLLQNNNWSGLVIDSSQENIAFIKNDEIYWRHDLTAIFALVTAENINPILSKAGFEGEIGLLHIDVDGNDYWIWEAIEVASPIIAIIEYNSLFGPDRAITIPYDPTFSRVAVHHSGLYAGASLLALCDLAEAKGYAFVGANSAGNNAYFVRQERLGDINAVSAQSGFVASRFREHRNEEGHLTYLSRPAAIESLRGMKVFNTRIKEVEDF